MKLSVIICTYNRVDFLDLCIQSIKSQIDKVDWAELIVVDNASKDATKQLIDTKYKNCVSYFYEEKQGLSHARNTGFNNSKGDWVAFIDDDAILRDGWLNSFLYTVNFYEFDCFGGPYYPWYKDGKEGWFLDIYGSNKKWLNYNFTQEIGKEFSGGNAVFKRSLLGSSPLFPTEIGMSGETQSYGEETYLINWLRENLNAKVGYVNELAIDHYVGLAKQKVSWYLKRALTEGRDFALSKATYKRKTVYLIKSVIQFFIFPLIVMELAVRNNYKISFTAILLEFLRPVLKVSGFLGCVFKFKKSDF